MGLVCCVCVDGVCVAGHVCVVGCDCVGSVLLIVCSWVRLRVCVGGLWCGFVYACVRVCVRACVCLVVCVRVVVCVWCV